MCLCNKNNFSLSVSGHCYSCKEQVSNEEQISGDFPQSHLCMSGLRVNIHLATGDQQQATLVGNDLSILLPCMIHSDTLTCNNGAKQLPTQSPVFFLSVF